MAEAYRGLKIRIGADTSGIGSAMKNLRSAANALQRDFRSMSNALRIDPKNTKLAEVRMRTLRDQAQVAAAETARLNTALRQTGNITTGLGGHKLKELAAETQNAHLRAARAKDSYNRLDEQLEKVYRSIGAYRVKANEKSPGLNYEIEQVKKLARNWQKAKDNEGIYAEISKAFGNSTRNPLGLKAENGKSLADTYVMAFRRIKAAWHETNAELKSMNKVVGFKNLSNDALLAESRIRQATAELVKMYQAEVRLGSGKMKELANEFQRISVQAKEAQNRIDRLDEALRLDPHNVNAASQKMLAFKERSEAASRQLETLHNRLKEMNAQGFDKAVAEARKLDKSVEQVAEELTEADTKTELLSQELKEAKVHARELAHTSGASSDELREAYLEVARLNGELKEAENKAKQVRHEFDIVNKAHEFREVSEETALAESRLSSYNRELRETVRLNRANLGASIKNMGYAGLSTITPAVMMAGMYMIQSANDIDAAYRNMRKTVQGTETDFENLKNAAQQFASHGVVSTDQVLEIQAMGGQLGIAVDKLDEFSEAIANITIATTITDASLAAEQLGQMANIMTDMREGLEAGEDVFGKYSDMIVRLGNNSATTEDKITQVLQRIAASGNLFGFTTPQLAALATAVASSGQGAEAAGTAISRSFSQIETACAKGGESLDKFAAVAGMSAEEFAKAWEEDAMGAYIAFIEGLKKIDEAGGSVDQTLIDLGINSVREKQTLESLVNMTDVLNDSLIMSQDAWNGVSDQFGQAGDAAREAQRKAEGFSGQFAILKNNGQIFASEMAEGLVPILKMVNNLVQNLTNVFSTLPTGFKTAIIGIAGGAAALAPLAVMFGVATNTMFNLGNQLGLLDSAWLKEVENEKKAGKEIRRTSGILDAYGRNMEYVEKTTKNAGIAASGASAKFVKLGKALKTLGKSSLVTLAIMAAIAAIGALIGAIQKAKAEQRAFEKATKGLTDATGALGSDFLELVGNVEGYGDAASIAAMDVNELTDALGGYVDKINETNRETQISVGNMEQWRSVLMHAIDDPEWGQEHIGEVEYAVRQINDATGATLDAQRLVSGEYENQRELVERITEAEIQRMQQEAAMQVLQLAQQAQGEAYLTMLKEQREYEQEIAEIRETVPALANASEEQIMGAFPYIQEEYYEATKAADEYAAACQGVEDAQGYVNDVMYDTANTASSLANKLRETDFDIFEGDDEQTLMEMGTSYEEVAESLERLGVSVSDLEAMGTEGVAELIGILTGENGEANAAAWLNDMGYAVDDVTGKTENFLQVAAQIDGENYVFTVSDDGTATEMYGRCEDLQAIEIDGKWFIIDDNGTGYTALGQCNAVEQARIDEKRFEVKADISPAVRKMNELTGMGVPAKWVDVFARTNTLVDSIKNALARKTFTANVKAAVSATFGGNAAGGIIGHAAGGFNGIVRRPILTNQGLIGEAGAEAVMRWAGGTAIVPLENRQYVRPFAQSVAQEMPMAFGAYGGVTAGEIAAALANMNLQVRMDSGELVGVLVNNSRRRAAMNV